MVNKFLVTVYSDERMDDDWAAYIESDDEDDAIGHITDEEAQLAVEDHYGNWECDFDDADELEDWAAGIDLHLHMLDSDELNDPDYMDWFNHLPVLHDERKSN